MVRVGIISSVDVSRQTVRVTHPDMDDRVSGELPVLKHVWAYAEPAVGDYVVCLYLSSGIREGVCLGSYEGVAS